MVDAHSPAFARPHSVDDGGDFRFHLPSQEGMDLRTYIAAQIMAGVISTPYQPWAQPDVQRAAAQAAVASADALIEELNK